MPEIVEWQTGVYQWLNLVNDKRYIGGAYVSFYRRKHTHLHALRHDKHRNMHLQAAWNKYGEDAFIFEVVERCAPTLVEEREQWWISDWWPTDSLYNLSPTAGSTLGLKQTEDAIANMTAAMLAIRDQISERMQGNQNGKGNTKPKSEAHKLKLALANLGKKPSEDTRAKLKKSPEQKAAIALACTGRRQSPETIAKRVAKLIGRKNTPEQRARMSEAAFKRYNKGG